MMLPSKKVPVLGKPRSPTLARVGAGRRGPFRPRIVDGAPLVVATEVCDHAG